ncbi:MAG: hypothetical protein DRJ69_04525, partial [Thermoprotei archaeon]
IYMDSLACPAAGSIDWHTEIDKLVAKVKPPRPEDVKHAKLEFMVVEADTGPKYGRGKVTIYRHFTIMSFLHVLWERGPIDKTLHRVVIPKLTCKAAIIYYTFDEEKDITHFVDVDTESSVEYWGQIEAFVNKRMPSIAIERHDGRSLLLLLLGI